MALADIVPDWGITHKCADTLMSKDAFWRLVPGTRMSLDVHKVMNLANALLRNGCDREILDELIANEQAKAARQGGLLPPMFREMIEALGINADVCLALSMISNTGLSVLKDSKSGSAEQALNINLSTQDMTWVTLGEERSSWRDDCILIADIPESYKATLIGKPLRHLLSHPILDDKDIMINTINDCWDDPDMVEIETNLHAQWKARRSA